MPSNSPIHSGTTGPEKGCLYVVSTPIGNKNDITLRALKILTSVDWIASEDTRHTGKLLSAHQIKSRLISCHEYNEIKRIPDLIKKLLSGASIALVSNAGTPAVSDPGYRLVVAAIANKIKVVPIPGVSAVVTALTAAGLPTDHFFFAGFLAKKKGKRLRQLKSLAKQTGTIVIYESPRRVLDLIGAIIATMGDRYGALAREMTKIHEEFIRGRLTEIAADLSARPEIKGECTLLVSGYGGRDNMTMEDIRKEIRSRLADGDHRISDIAKEIAEKSGLSKNIIYQETLAIRNNRHLK